jgi:putative peptide zinc metalloprotease protein
MTDTPAQLPLFRDELEILEGPLAANGAPTWTIFDPIRNRFFKMDWAAFEVLARWRAGDAGAVSEKTNAETSLHITPEFVTRLANFLTSQQLTRPSGAAALAQLDRTASGQNQSWWLWLMHHYLFFRVPLVRPDRFLAAAYPWVRWLFSGPAKILLGLALVIGLFLLMRQWEQFRTSLIELLSLKGLLYFGLALAFSKIAHELGHAFTAKRYGCHVPTMGIAFLVLWPMLFTDCNETWKLKDRRQRLSVASAGMLVEISIAIVATLLWSFLPEGAAKDMTFVLATTTWVSSLVINILPFMRFDGYFLLSDLLDFPNLHERSSNMARWMLREVLFDLGEPPPERHSARMTWFLIVFAGLVWAYRLLLFLGIAILVYHFFIKVVGVLLFALEIGWFILRPLAAEMRQWGRRRSIIFRRGRTVLSTIFVAGLLSIFALPWQSKVSAPALVQAQNYIQIYAASEGRILASPPKDGSRLRQGDAVIRLANPGLGHRRDQLSAKRKVLKYELGAGAYAEAFRKRNDVIAANIAGIDAQLSSFRLRDERLTTKAPFTGLFFDAEPNLSRGQWINRGQRIGAMRSEKGAMIIAYVDEDDVFRVKPGAACRFYSVEPDHLATGCRVQFLEITASAVLPEASFASVFGGAIPVRATDAGLVPERAVYRAHLAIDGGPRALPTQISGRVRIDADKISPLHRFWTWALAVLIRESGL